MYSFPYLEPVCCSMSSPNYCFLICIQISQEAGQVVWYSHLLKNFPQLVLIYTVKGFGVVNIAEVDVFLELSCFFDDPKDVDNLISGSSAFSKSAWTSGSSQFMYCWSLDWWILSFACMWEECNFVVVWTFFGIAFLWDWNENLLFQSCGHCWIFQISWQIESSTFTTSSFRIWNSSTAIPSPPLALFVDFLPKAHLTLHSRMSGSRWVFTPLWLSGGADVITEIKCTINFICFSHPETPTLLTSMKKMLFHETSLLCQKGWGPQLQGIYTSCSIIQLGPNLCNPMDYSPPGSSVHAISPERILEWVVISSSRRFSQPRDETPVSSISYVSWVSRIAGGFFITEPPGKSKSINWLFVTLWTVAHQVSSVHRIVQTRILEWVANPYLRASSQPRKWTPGLLHCKQIPYSLSHPGS